jgi:beta-N-acetylhexosaminidase
MVMRLEWRSRPTVTARRVALLLMSVALLCSCSTSSAAQAPSPTPIPTPSPTPQPSPSPSPPPADQLGPGGLTLDEEIGAVMMVGFQGPLSGSVLADWQQRQFGGLLIINGNHNAGTASSVTALISAVRGVSRHRLIAATDQEGGYVCLAVSSVPCAPMPVDQAQTTRMASALKALGFDLDLGPVSDVCSGSSSIMWGRCYGTQGGAVADWVGGVVEGIHAAHMLSAAKHFPGHGNTTVSSEIQLPQINESLATLQARDWPPFAADISHGVDFVMLGHLYYPALDPIRSADLSPATIDQLRSNLGFTGAILSDDMEMGAITASTPAPEAAVEYLLAGGDMVMIAHHISVVDATYNAIRQAVLSGRLPRARLDDAVATLQAVATP